MNIRLQVIVMIACLFMTIFIVNMIRREKLELKYSLIWIISNIAIVICCIFPFIIEWAAKLIGIAAPMNGLFFAAIVFLLILGLLLTISQSRNSKKIKDLTQKIGLLEAKLKEIEES